MHVILKYRPQQYPQHALHPFVKAQTCHAGKEMADRLEVESYGLRWLVCGDTETMVLIVREQSEEDEADGATLQVPYHIHRTSNNSKVTVLRKSIGLVNGWLPNLPQAKQINLYVNSEFTLDPALLDLFTSEHFFFSEREYHLDLAWLTSCLKNCHSLRERVNWMKLLGEEKDGRYRHYVRMRLEAVGGEKGRWWVFKRGFTKINVIAKSMHPYNLYRSITPLPLETNIFQLPEYEQLRKELEKSIQQSGVILLEAEKEAGTDILLNWVSQTSDLNYLLVDCKDSVSIGDFYRSVQRMRLFESSVIHLKNLSWLQNLSQADQLTNFQIKQVLRRLQEMLKEAVGASLRKYIFVIESEDQTITVDMFREAKGIKFELNKERKLSIFSKVLASFQLAQAQTEANAQLFHDKFGWQVLLKFLRNNWGRLKKQSQSALTDALKALVKQEQAANLIAVSWDDVGGLQAAKEEIVQTVLLPIRHPQIFDEWITPRTGLLFYGPPGTGKTLLGKCIARECGMSFLSVKGPELLNMYVGESEKNVRQVFQRAAACRPCIVFMDELDALIPKRGSGGDSQQVMDRIVAELLLQMDSAPSQQIFVIGATNRPDLLDPSILRPGRFDKQIYLGITTNSKDRLKILKAQTRHLNLSPNLNWQKFLEKIPQNFTGADFYGLTSKAVMAAAERTIKQYDSGTPHDKITICEQDFTAAAAAVKPSVTEQDLRKYDELRKIYS